MRTAPLPLFYIHSPSLRATRPSTSVLLSSSPSAARTRSCGREAVCSCVSLSIARTFSLVCRPRHPPPLARSRSFPPPRRPPPAHATVSFSSVPFASFSNLRRQCCTASAEGRGPETRGAAMLTRSAPLARTLASPRPRFASSPVRRFFAAASKFSLLPVVAGRRRRRRRGVVDSHGLAPRCTCCARGVIFSPREIIVCSRVARPGCACARVSAGGCTRARALPL